MKALYFLTLTAAAGIISCNASAATISPTTSNAQVIGSVLAGSTYTITATGTVYLCGSCNSGGPLVFNPDGTAATVATGSYAPFNTAPQDHDPSVGPTAYGFYGAGINVGELYGSFSATPAGSDLFAIGYGTSFTASASGTLYGVINDTAYGDNPGSAQFDVTLSDSSAAVPEPAAWAMMVAGFGLIGGAMRRKRMSVSFA